MLTYFCSSSHLALSLALLITGVGSSLLATNCLFTIQPNRERWIREDQEFHIGADVFIAAGFGNFIRCEMFVLEIGFVNGWGHEMGGSVFMAAGVASFTMTNFCQTMIFSYVIGGGVHVVMSTAIALFQGKVLEITSIYISIYFVVSYLLLHQIMPFTNS